MKHLRWAIVSLIVAGFPLSASAGFGFGFSDDGFDTWDPQDYPYGYPNRRYDRNWGSRYRRHPHLRGPDLADKRRRDREWNDDWDNRNDDNTSSFSFGSNTFHFGDSWSSRSGDGWGRYRRPYGPRPYGYYPPPGTRGGYAPAPAWGYAPNPAPQPAQEAGASPDKGSSEKARGGD